MVVQNRFFSVWFRRWGVSLACLLAFFYMGVNTAWQKSATADEPVHLTRGIVLAQGEDYRLQQEHAPLSHWLIGGFLRTERLPDVTEQNGWEEAERLWVARGIFEESDLDVRRVVWLGRLPIVLVGVLLGGVMMRWAREMSGRAGQVAAAVLFAFSPNLIAHGVLATTDFVTAVSYTLSLYMLWRFWERPSWVNWGLAGICLGLGLASKMTGLLLLPLTGLLSYGHLLFVRPYEWGRWREDFGQALWGFVRPTLIWLSFLPLAGLVVWGVYQFEVGEVVIPQWGVATVPAATYAESIVSVMTHIDEGHLSFLNGEISTEGWWEYFAIAFLIKTSFPLLMLLVVAIWRRRFGEMIFFWLPAVLLFGFATYARLNIGYRHILPMVPFVAVWAAVTFGQIWEAWVHTDEIYQPFYRTAGLMGLMGLLVGQIFVGVRQHPDHLAYFNLLVGGTAEGYQYLLDSNLDWGQEWYTAVDYVNQNSVDTVYFAPSGFISPERYGLQGQSLIEADGFGVAGFPAANPPAGTYLLSANVLQGVTAERDLLAWFRGQEPVAVLGGAVFVYEVEEAAEGDWVAQCDQPVVALDGEQVADVVGAAARLVTFDCTQSWVFPNGGDAGWYVLPEQDDDWWLSEVYPENFQQVYTHRADQFASGYAVYYWDGGVDVREGFRPEGFEAVSVGEVALLVGYTAEERVWRTVWAVTGETNRPLSVLGHLYAGGATPAGVMDGLGYRPEQWRVGDVFVQTHRFVVDGEVLETGLYAFTTGERLLTAGGEMEIRLEMPSE